MGYTVEIVIKGTERDSELLKKSLRKYMEQCSEEERLNCECYIGLIEYAEEQAIRGNK